MQLLRRNVKRTLKYLNRSYNKKENRRKRIIVDLFVLTTPKPQKRNTDIAKTACMQSWNWYNGYLSILIYIYIYTYIFNNEEFFFFYGTVYAQHIDRALYILVHTVLNFPLKWKKKSLYRDFFYEKKVKTSGACACSVRSLIVRDF